MINEIGSSMGIKKISQWKTADAYLPRLLAEQNLMGYEIGTELLRVLKNTNTLAAEPLVPGETPQLPGIEAKNNEISS